MTNRIASDKLLIISKALPINSHWPFEFTSLWNIQTYFKGFFGDFVPADVFLGKLKTIRKKINEECLPEKELLKASLNPPDGDTSSRYLLFLTKNNAALTILQVNFVKIIFTWILYFFIFLRCKIFSDQGSQKFSLDPPSRVTRWGSCWSNS